MENEAGVLGLAIVLGLISASAVTWLVCVVRASGGRLLRYAPRRKVPWGLLDLALAMVLVISASLAAGQLLFVLAEIDPRTPLAELTAKERATLILASSLSMLVGVLLSLGLIWLKNRSSRDDFGVNFDNLGRDVGIGVVAFLLLSAPVYAIQYLLVEILQLHSEHPLIELAKRNPDPRFFLVTFMAAVVFAPVTEEFFFRVLLQGWLERIPAHRGDTKILLLGGADVTSIPLERPSKEKEHIGGQPEPQHPFAEQRPATTDNPYASPVHTGKTVDLTQRPAPMWPVIISSLIFAVVHISHGVDPVPLFVLALGLGFVYRQTHRVLPCIITHMLFNAFSVVLLLVEVYGGPR